MNHQNNRLRILWVSDSPLLGTGFARVTREVVSRLACIPSVEIACLGWHYDGWPYPRTQFPAPIFPSPDPTRSQSSFDRAFAEFRPDVVISLAELWMIDWLRLHRNRPRFKWIAYLPVDGCPFYPPWTTTLQNVDQIVAMSKFGRDVLREGMPSHDIRVLYHGVDTSVFRPLEDRPRLKSHERFRDRFVVGCVARNQPRKNIPALVKAIAILAGRIENLHLYLHMDPCDVGYDIVTLLHRFRLEGRADVSGLNFSVNQCLDDEQLNRLYNLFDLTVLPSTGEGFGLPIIESFAAGVPVAATDFSACSELLRGRGELVKVKTTMTSGPSLLDQALIDVEDLAARIEKLHGEPELLRSHSEAGLSFAKTLTWDSLMPQWLEVIGAATGRIL